MGNLKLMDTVNQVMNISNNWGKTITDRLFKCYMTGQRDSIRSPLSAMAIKLARTMQLFASMKPTFDALNKGQLASLRPRVEGGIVYTSGRCDKAMLSLLGIFKMPILARETRLATLIMWECHYEDHHSSPTDVLAILSHIEQFHLKSRRAGKHRPVPLSMIGSEKPVFQ